MDASPRPPTARSGHEETTGPGTSPLPSPASPRSRRPLLGIGQQGGTKSPPVQRRRRPHGADGAGESPAFRGCLFDLSGFGDISRRCVRVPWVDVSEAGSQGVAGAPKSSIRPCPWRPGRQRNWGARRGVMTPGESLTHAVRRGVSRAHGRAFRRFHRPAKPETKKPQARPGASDPAAARARQD